VNLEDIKDESDGCPVERNHRFMIVQAFDVPMPKSGLEEMLLDVRMQLMIWSDLVRICERREKR
jgi:hypothetical protein